ncbi:dihydrodipicolinate synthase family protein [Brucella abortus]|nr:dihydrodipicolinate synthase family protein [Brucella abortus]
MLKGSITALVTPFDREGAFDEKAFRAFVNWQIEEGTKGLVPVGMRPAKRRPFPMMNISV